LGSGPAEGLAFIVNGIPVSIPLAADYFAGSPFSLQNTY
jgi:hypothetical protein